MTENERMIWAAVFARHYSGAEDDLRFAIYQAWAAVVDLREYGPKMPKDGRSEMTAEMLKR